MTGSGKKGKGKRRKGGNKPTRDLRAEAAEEESEEEEEERVFSNNYSEVCKFVKYKYEYKFAKYKYRCASLPATYVERRWTRIS